MAATGAIGEISAMSIGIGYTLPFELIGATWMDGRAFSSQLNELRIPGIFFRPTKYRPFYGFSSGQTCSGAHVMRTSDEASPFTATIGILTALRDSYANRKPFSHVAADRWSMFDKICGTDLIRKQLLDGRSFREIIEAWQPGVRAFVSQRMEYVLYE
jgi:uncharacterized protein YbbC (DUF1343 family)